MQLYRLVRLLRLLFSLFFLPIAVLLISCQTSRECKIGKSETESPLRVTSGYIIASGGARLYYEVAGKGSPVILVHGHSLDMRMWDEQFSCFAQEHRVVRYDCRGYGRSSKQSETFHFLHVEDLLTVMDSLKIDKAHIVGLSMGGFITADMLVYAPERMLSAVMANGHFRKSPGPSEPYNAAEEAKRDSAVAQVRAEGIDLYKQRWYNSLITTGGAEVERIKKPLWTMISDWDGWQATHKEVRLLLGRDGIKMLEEKKPSVPTLVMTGIEKPRPGVKAPSFMKHLPRSRWQLFEETGHMMNMERPVEFNTAVLEFLQEVDASVMQIR